MSAAYDDDAIAEAMSAAGDFDPAADVYCTKCGLDWLGCGCEADPNTYWRLKCPDCGALQSASWSPAPPQRPCFSCGRVEPVDVERAPLYAPVGRVV